MPTPITLTLADLSRLRPIIRREAWRALRRRGLPAQEREDVEQELLLDLLQRLPAFDAARGSLEAFATVCARHHAVRCAERLRRDRGRQHCTRLDDPVALDDDGTLTLAETLPEAAALWPAHADATMAVEQRVDLARAAVPLALHDQALCLAMSRGGMQRALRATGISRASAYRRLAELRLGLLAAGISTAA